MSDEEMKERCLIPARLMLDEDCDEETFDFEKEDRSVVELTAREHKPAVETGGTSRKRHGVLRFG